MLEKLIAYHCGPSLAGIKPANLVSCPKHSLPDIWSLNEELNPRGIYIKKLCECERRALLIVYRKKVLNAHLLRAEIQAFLEKYGYCPNQSEEVYLDQLKERFHEGEFPHEIGAFLGYPIHDIEGFIHHHGEGCLLVGEWKVYEDAQGAKKLFSRYQACRKALKERVASGKKLAEIFSVA